MRGDDHFGTSWSGSVETASSLRPGQRQFSQGDEIFLKTCPSVAVTLGLLEGLVWWMTKSVEESPWWWPLEKVIEGSVESWDPAQASFFFTAGAWLVPPFWPAQNITDMSVLGWRQPQGEGRTYVRNSAEIGLRPTRVWAFYVQQLITDETKSNTIGKQVKVTWRIVILE